MAAILVFFFDLLSCPCRQSQRIHIAHAYVSLFTYIHKMNNATVAFFLKFMSIFLKFMYSLFLHEVCKMPNELRSIWSYFVTQNISTCDEMKIMLLNLKNNYIEHRSLEHIDWFYCKISLKTEVSGNHVNL